MRRIVIAAVVLALLGGGGYALWTTFTKGEPPPPIPIHKDKGEALSTQQQFAKLAETDPVKMLDECLTRYQREVKGGMHATLQKQERVQGKPKHPEMPEVEVIDLWVRGDVPDTENKTAIEVLMKWKSGAKSFLGSEIRGTLFSEKPKAEGGYDGKVVTWRPTATFSKLSFPTPPNSDLAKGQSRYCIRDAGLYRAMLRTHEAWKKRQQAGELKLEFLGKQTPASLGRECYAIKRICNGVEVDSFELGGTATGDPATEGFTEVTIYVDVERWIQIGSELYRTEPDGTRVLVGAYYFRDVQLNPGFPPDTFTAAGR